jgi:hypothetical protein
LRIVGRQVRFLSKFFLSRSNSLVHGIEIFKEHLDDGLVQEIAEARAEQDFYTFQTVLDAVKEAFPAYCDPIMAGLVEMLAFDAIVGNNDRHPANWGAIVPLKENGPAPRFSPIYDTARALFWNCDETRVARIISSPDLLRSYVERSRPQIGWDWRDGIKKLGHFDLIYLIYPNYRLILDRLRCYTPLDDCANLVAREFSELMTPQRRKAVIECLRLRHQLYVEAISKERDSP